jgi:hypothetical protein
MVLVVMLIFLVTPLVAPLGILSNRDIKAL